MTKRRRIVVGAIAVVASAMALIGFGHTRYGRPLLAWMGGGSARCPVLAGASKETLEARRVEAMKPLRGAEPAPAPVAFTDLVLSRSSRSDVEAWASNVGLACEDKLAGAAMHCERAGECDAKVRDVFFRFDGAGTLVGIDAMHAPTTGALAADEFAMVRARLETTLGAATATIGGEPTGEYLSAEPLRRSGIEYRFRDYAIDVSATNFGDRGVVLREQYRAVGGVGGS